ncbi:MAG TPA: hypothetical protein DCP91_12670 [Eggerthellaceae bacterium]|nr:hypothetical protein [Eggerthellaceae bacterium]
MKTIGIISDTHGKLPSSAVAALRGEYAASQVFHHVAVDAQDDMVLAAQPCDLVAHAGDFGYAARAEQWIVDELCEIAPLVAVAGNCDYGEMYELNGRPLPQYAVFEECGVSCAMLHDPADLRAAVRGAGPTRPSFISPAPRVLVHGHTHEQKVILSADGTVTVCPGAISRPRGGNPATVAIVKVDDPGMVLTVDIVAV